MKKTSLLILLSLFTYIFTFAEEFVALKAETAPTIDGIANEECWEKATWYAIDKVWIPFGADVPAEDFTGKFKVVWTENRLYILAEIVDDVLSDDHVDPVDNYWNDDCLEVFLDEDASGGDHQYNYNAFAYHISKDFDIVDNSEARRSETFNDHVTGALTNNGNTYTWEVEIIVYDDSFVKGGSNTPVTLYDGKMLGMSVAYCDNDDAPTNDRENFFGSTTIPEENYNDHWINASWFSSLELVDSTTGVEPEPTGTEDVKQMVYFQNSISQGAPINFFVNTGSIEFIEFYSLTGTLISKSDVQQIDSSSFGVGEYIIKIVTNKETFVEKLLVK